MCRPAHRDERRDADAARDEEHIGCRHESEVIAGAADPDGVARRELVMHVSGASASVRFAQDRHAVARAIGRVAADGVLALHTAVQDQVDVRARLPRRQVAPIRRHEVEGNDAVCHRRLRLDQTLPLDVAEYVHPWSPIGPA